MPATAPASVERTDFGPIDVGSVELGGYTTDFLHIKAPIDMNLMLQGLPTGARARTGGSVPRAG